MAAQPSRSKCDRTEVDMAANRSAARARNTPQPYRCFLLRCRLETGVGCSAGPAWRFTIELAGQPDAARRSFTSLDDVTAYLEAELAGCGGLLQEEPSHEGVGDGQTGRSGNEETIGPADID